MEGLLPTESPLDTELSSLRYKIRALRHRRALLTHTLLSSPRFATHLRSIHPSPSLPQSRIAAALTQLTTHANDTSTTLHRALAGITAFRIRDPDPNAVDGGRVLGVRIEGFSAGKRAFESAVYLFFVRGEEGKLRLARHTVPEFVGVKALESRFLLRASRQDLQGFVRAVRREVLRARRRGEAVESVKGVGGVKEVRVLDASGGEAELTFEKGIVARIMVGEDGTIQTVAVGLGRGEGQYGDDREGMQKIGQIQRLVQGGDGRIEGLAERLQRRPKS